VLNTATLAHAHISTHVTFDLVDPKSKPHQGASCVPYMVTLDFIHSERKVDRQIDRQTDKPIAIPVIYSVGERG